MSFATKLDHPTREPLAWESAVPKSPKGRRCGLLLVVLAIGWLLEASGPTKGLTAADRKQLSDRIERIIRHRAGGIRVGICIRRIADGTILYRRRYRERFILASNTKLATTATALSLLGKEGFEVRLLASGPIDIFGNLEGDLLVSPPPPSPFGRYANEELVEAWIEGIRAREIHSVMGGVLLDMRGGQANGAGGDYHKATAETPLVLLVTPGTSAGRKARVGIRPSGTSARIINRCVTIPGATRKVSVRRRSSGAYLVEGRIGLAAGTVTHLLASGHPALALASELRQALTDEGIPVLGSIGVNEGKAEGETVAVGRARITGAIRRANKHSDNQTAEAILRSLNPGGSRKAALAKERQFLRSLGLSTSSFALADGSGLSRKNTMTPEAMTLLLARMAKGPHGDIFQKTLAVPGGEGTLEGRLARIDRYGNLAAKTGHIRGVNTLSGYFETKKGGYAFTLLTNGSNGRRRARNSTVDSLLLQMASALAVSDGAIRRNQAEPAPTFRKRRHRRRRH